MERYELRLLGPAGETVRIYQLSCTNDERAREAVLSVPDDYARFEVWRGMQRIAEGGRFIVAGPTDPSQSVFRNP